MMSPYACYIIDHYVTAHEFQSTVRGAT